MTEEHPKEKSAGKPVLLGLEDFSDEYLELLVTYGQEVEVLDYKETLECDDQRKKARVDLACDLSAMANTNGGYVVVGVKEEEDKTFTPIGVSPEVLKTYTYENIVGGTKDYIDGQPTIRAKTSKYKGDDYLVIFVKKAAVPFVFYKDGDHTSKQGKTKKKFRAGEIFVRHGGRSERATHEDIRNMFLAIREDERMKNADPVGRHAEVMQALGDIAELLGGEQAIPLSMNLTHSNAEQIKAKTVRLISSGRPKELVWMLKSQASSLKTRLGAIIEETEDDKLAEELDREYAGFLKGLSPVWFVAVELDDMTVASSAAQVLYELYIYAGDSMDPIRPSGIDGLWLQARAVYYAYCLGAYSVYRDAPGPAREIVSKTITKGREMTGYSLIRATTIRLSRAGRSENKSICKDVLDYFQNNEAVLDAFSSMDAFERSVCQFDYLQCVYSLIAGNGNFFPSFAYYHKTLIDEIAEKIVETREQGLWIPVVGDEQLAEAIRTIDDKANGQFFHQWLGGIWDSQVVKDLLMNNPHDSR